MATSVADQRAAALAAAGMKRITQAKRLMHRHTHILNAASNLLGICFVIISGLKIANLNTNSYSDETAWVSAMLLLTSVITSYTAIRNSEATPWHTALADGAFMAGVLALTLSVVLAATTL